MKQHFDLSSHAEDRLREYLRRDRLLATAAEDTIDRIISGEANRVPYPGGSGQFFVEFTVPGRPGEVYAVFCQGTSVLEILPLPPYGKPRR